MTRKQLFTAVLDYFSRAMPEADTELRYHNEFELIVAVVLSAQCTDRRVNQVTPALFAAYPTPEAMSRATAGDIYPYIRSVSYPNSKAAHLAGLARMLCSEFGGRLPETIDELTRLPGVGRKTANVIEAVLFGRKAMPVDTHVFRVSHRIGLVPPRCTTPLSVERELLAHIPDHLAAKSHHWLLLHGRYVCTARSPKCSECGLQLLCKLYKKEHTGSQTPKA
ncbi:MAG: endonuclease III [Bacteroidaceae bacterium]|nr:endonuclease III [Bacteroidaceae bacterium]